MKAITGLVIIALFAVSGTAPTAARDDGRYAQSSLKQWFDQIRSGKGNCCSFADGFTIKDADWTTDGAHYRVRVEGAWVDVPDDALVTEPNRYGSPVVWPVKGPDGSTQIRCFMPGALT